MRVEFWKDPSGGNGLKGAKEWMATGRIVSRMLKELVASSGWVRVGMQKEGGLGII